MELPPVGGTFRSTLHTGDWRLTTDIGLCPTCGQPLPEAQIEAARLRFEAGKAQRLDSVNRRGAAVSQQVIAEMSGRAESLAGEVERLTATVAALGARLAGLTARRAEPAPFEQTEAYRRLAAQASRLTDRATSVPLDRLCNAASRLADLRNELAAAIAGQGVRRRIDQLKAEQSRKSAELDETDRGLAMCDRFTSLKASLVTERVNGLFKAVRWQLFRPLVNGGLEQVCNPLTQGADGAWVEWRSSNTASQVSAGLEIAHVLNGRFGTELPAIIDRAESVSRPVDVPEQTIRLVVSAADDTIRVVTK